MYKIDNFKRWKRNKLRWISCPETESMGRFNNNELLFGN
jgi:hypothetical protein